MLLNELAQAFVAKVALAVVGFRRCRRNGYQDVSGLQRDAPFVVRNVFKKCLMGIPSVQCDRSGHSYKAVAATGRIGDASFCRPFCTWQNTRSLKRPSMGARRQG